MPDCRIRHFCDCTAGLSLLMPPGVPPLSYHTPAACPAAVKYQMVRIFPPPGTSRCGLSNFFPQKLRFSGSPISLKSSGKARRFQDFGCRQNTWTPHLRRGGKSCRRRQISNGSHFSATRSFALRALGFSASSSSPETMGLRVMSFTLGFLPHTQTGKFGGQVQPRAIS